MENQNNFLIISNCRDERVKDYGNTMKRENVQFKHTSTYECSYKYLTNEYGI